MKTNVSACTAAGLLLALTVFFSPAASPAGQGSNALVLPGKTEPNARVVIFRQGKIIREYKADAKGRFELNVELEPGANEYVVANFNEIGKFQSKRLSVVVGKYVNLTLSASPSTLQLKKDRTSSVVVTAVDREHNPVSGLTLQPVASTGRTGPVTEPSPGVYTFDYMVPDIAYPSYAVIAVTIPSLPDEVLAKLFLPLEAGVTLPGVTEPGTEVRASLQDMQYGPVKAGADGKFQIPITAGPGERLVKMTLVDVAGNVTTRTTDLGYPASRTFFALPWRTMVSSDGLDFTDVHVVLTGQNGVPVTGAPPAAECDTGSVRFVEDAGPGAYRYRFRPAPSAAPREARIAFTRPRVERKEELRLGVYPGAPRTLAVSALSDSLTADGQSKTEIVTRVADLAGTGLPAWAPEVTEETREATLGPVTDRSDGTYATVLTAPLRSTRQTSSIRSRLVPSPPAPGEWSMTLSPRFLGSLPEGPAVWLIEARLSSSAGEPALRKIVTFELRDADGIVTPSAWTDRQGRARAACVLRAGAVSGRISGRISARVDGEAGLVGETAIPALAFGPAGSPAVDPPVAALLAAALIESSPAFLPAPVLAETPITFKPDLPALMALKAEPDVITADGSSTSNLTATVTDRHGNPCPGLPVTMVATAGTLSGVSDLGGGLYGATLTAPTGLEPDLSNITAQAQSDAYNLTAATVVRFTAGAAGLLVLKAEPDELEADGSSTSTLTAQLFDPNGNPVSGATILFSLASGDGTVSIPSALTDARGVARSLYTASLTPGVETVKADAQGTGLTAYDDIREQAFAAAEIALTATPSEIPADGASRSRLDATVRDGLGNTLADSLVIFQLVSGDGSLSAVQERTKQDGIATIYFTSSLTPDVEVVRAESALTPSVADEAEIREVGKTENVASFETTAPACWGTAVRFTDTSTGAVVERAWDFDGDGATDSMAEAPSVDYQIEGPGTYQASLDVVFSDGTALRADRPVVIWPAPAAAFSNTAPVCTGATVNFENLTWGGTPPYTATWTYGDGETAPGTVLSHVYARPGQYTVTLEVADANGCESTASADLEIGSNLIAAFTARIEDCSRLRLSFTSELGLVSGPVEYEWNFGDGHVSRDSRPVHTFPQGGTYRVHLRVMDDKGCTGEAWEDVTAGVPLAVSGLRAERLGCPSRDAGDRTRFKLETDPPTGGVPPYRYSWWSSLDGNLGESTEPTIDTRLSSGTHALRLTVSDSAPASEAGPCAASTEAAGVVVDEPIGTAIVEVRQKEPATGSPARALCALRAMPALGGKPPYEYRWGSSLDGLLATTSSPDVDAYLSPGSHEITLDVFDSTPPDRGGPCAARAQTTQALVVPAIEAAMESAAVVACTEPSRGAEALLTASQATGGTPPYTYRFSSSRQGVLADGPDSSVRVFLEPGTHGIAVVVTDSTRPDAGGPFTAGSDPLSITVPGPLTSSIAGTSVLGWPAPGKALMRLEAAQASGATAPYRYQWSSDRAGDLGWSASPVSEHVLDQGVHQISLSVTDSTPAGTGGPCLLTLGPLRVVVPAEIASGIRALAPKDCAAGAPPRATVLLSAIPAAGGTAPFTYTWSSAADGALGSSSSPDMDALLSSGRHTITLTVTDSTPAASGGPLASLPYQGEVEVPALIGSGILSIEQRGCTVSGSAAVRLRASSATGGTAPYMYRWTSDRDGVIAESSSAEVDARLSAGSHQVRLIVTDAAQAGRGGPCSWTSAPETARIVAELTAEIAAATQVSCITPVSPRGRVILEAAQPAGGTAPYTYRWISDPAGDLGSTSARSLTVVLDPGVHTVTLEVTDSTPPELAGPCTVVSSPRMLDVRTGVAAAIASARVLSCAGGLPEATSVELRSATALGGTPPFTYRWSSDLQGDLGSTSSEILSVSLRSGLHSITVEATDSTPGSAGGPCSGASAPVTLTVPGPLVAVVETVSQKACASGSPGRADVYLKARFATGGVAPYTYAWSSDIDGPLGSGSASDLTANLSSGRHRITLTVTDSTPPSQGGPCVLAAPAVDVDVTTPLAGGISSSTVRRCFSGNPGTAGVELVAVPASGGTPPYRYRWTSDLAGVVGESIDPIFTADLTAGQHSISLDLIDSTPPSGGGACSLAAGPVAVLVKPGIDSGIADLSIRSCPSGAGGLTDVEFSAVPATGGFGPYTYEWRSDRDGYLGSSAAGALTALLTPGSHAITLAVTDTTPPGNGGPCWVEFGPATIDIAGPLISSISEAAPVSCPSGAPLSASTSLRAVPARGGYPPYTYTWESDISGPIGSVNLPDLQAPLNVGTHHVTLTVTDSLPPANGGPCAFAAPEAVVDVPELPRASIILMDMRSCVSGTPPGADVWLEASPALSGIGPYTYQWTSDLAGDLGTSALPSLLTRVYSGSHTITLTIHDSTPPSQGGPCSAVVDSEPFTVMGPVTADITAVALTSCTRGSPPMATATFTAAPPAGGTAPYAYRWTSDVQGVIVSGANFVLSGDLQPGLHTVTLEVTDSTPPALGGPCIGLSVPFSIDVPAPPTAAITSVAQAACALASPDRALTAFRGSPAAGGVPPYSYTWTSNPDGMIATVATPDFDGLLRSGAHDITLTVTDSTPAGMGGPCSATTAPVSVTVAGPVLVTLRDITTLACAQGLPPGAQVQFGANAATGGIAPYTYQWDSSLDGMACTLQAPSCTGSLGPGTHSITLSVSDSSPYGPCTFTLAPPAAHTVEPPLVSGIASVRAAACWYVDPVARTVQVELNAVPASGGVPPYTYSWASDLAGNIIANMNPANTVILAAGAHTLTLTVTDSTPAGQGGVCTWTVSRAVSINGPVTASITGAERRSCASGVPSRADMRLLAAVSQGTPPFTLAWSSSIEGALGSTSNPAFDARLLSGTHIMTLQVTDSTPPGIGGPCTTTVSAPVVVPDVLTVVAGSDSPTVYGEATTFEAFTTGGTAPLSFAWNFGDGSGTGSGSPAIYYYWNSGAYQAVVTATDADGCTASDSASVLVSDLPQETNGQVSGDKTVNVIDNDGNRIVTPGDVLEYTISVWNIASDFCGSGAGKEAIQDPIPPELTYIAGSASAPDPLECAAFTRTGPDEVVYVGSVEGGTGLGTTGVIKFSATIRDTVPIGTVITNLATVFDPYWPVPIASFILVSKVEVGSAICRADAGPDQAVCSTLYSGETSFALDGTGSSTFNDPIVSYTWTILSDTTGGARLWNNRSVNPSVDVPNPTGPNTTSTVVIQLEIMDISGCVSTDTVTVMVDTPSTVTIVPGNPTHCENAPPLELDSGAWPPGTTFLWSTNPAGQPGDNETTRKVLVAPSATTVYTVTVTETSGCSSNASRTVTFFPAPEAKPGGPYEACQRYDQILTTIPVDGSGSSAPAPRTVASYQWTTDIAGASFTDPAAAVTDLRVSNTGALIQGTVTLTVIDSFGCLSSAASAQVTLHAPPQAGPGGPYNTCETAGAPTTTLALDGSGSTGFTRSIPAGGYAWSTDIPGAVFSDPNVASPTLILPNTGGLTLGTVTLFVTNDMGCPSQPIAANVRMAPSPTADPGGPYEACEDAGSPITAVTVDGSNSAAPLPWSIPATGHAWTTDIPGATFADPTAAVTGLNIPNTGGLVLGTVTLRVTNSEGCTSSPVTTRVRLDPAPTAAGGGPYFGCGITGSLTLDGTASSAVPPASLPPAGYLWTTDLPGASFVDPAIQNPVMLFPDADAAGNVRLTVTDSEGCPSASFVTTIDVLSSASGPAVFQTAPKNADRNVRVNATIMVRFDRDIDPATAPIDIVEMVWNPITRSCEPPAAPFATGLAVTSYNATNFRAQYAPPAFSNLTCYEVTVPASVAETHCGNTMGAPYTFWFVTEPLGVQGGVVFTDYGP